MIDQIELGLGSLPQEFVALRTAAEDLNAVAGPAMHDANDVIKTFLTNDQIDALVGDDPGEGAGDAILNALEVNAGGDDRLTDFDGDGALLDFGDMVSAYDALLGQLPEGSGQALVDAANTLTSNSQLVDAVETAFDNLLSADLGDAFWNIVGAFVS